jgi:hypothetical protein
MRGARLQGRFDIDYEALRIYEGIKEDLQHPVGVEVSWFRWNAGWAEENAATVKDPIYDVSNSGFLQGRRWVPPFSMPAISAQLIRGNNEMNERGFYVVDSLHISLNVGDVERMLPTMLTDPNSHIKDRIVYRGNVFTPTRVLPRGHFGYRWSVVTIECLEVNSDELVNDPQFQHYALKGTQDMLPRAELGYGFNGYGEGSYGL